MILGYKQESDAVPAPVVGKRAKEPDPDKLAHRQRMAQSILLPAITLFFLAIVWQAYCDRPGITLPGPIQTVKESWNYIAHPFFDHGSNDVGLGWQLASSLKRVGAGYGLAAVTGVFIGILLGKSVMAYRAFDPIFQILRTIPPLAWLPLSLATFNRANPSAIFVIFITAIWPIIINTSVGVMRIPRDYENVASVYQIRGARYFFRILLPAASPYIFTGLRIAIGMAWLAIIAAEMLTGGVGIGFFIWDSWNSSRLSDIIVSVVYVGLVGLLLDRAIALLARLLEPVWISRRIMQALNPSVPDNPRARFVNLRGIHQVFGGGASRYYAIEEVNLDVAQGEFVSIIGHSGCGKSTLLNIVAGLVQPTLGSVIVGGRHVTQPGLDRAVVFQSHSLLPWMSVVDNVRIGIDSVHPDWSRKQSREEAMRFVEMVHLGAHAGKKPDELSGGMKQRVGIARAFAVNPAVLLLDEPFGALDALTRGNMQDELTAIWENSGKTVLMITHDVDEAIFLSDRVVLMGNGPKAGIAEIVPVEISRPRTREDLIESAEYVAVRKKIVHYLITTGHGLKVAA